MSMDVEPVTLTGRAVRLEPLRREHAEGLFHAAQDPTIWTLMSANPSVSMEAMHRWIDRALQAQETGEEVPFTIIALATNEIVGSTRYMAIMPRNRGLEIGWTWLGSAARRTAVNTECKYLLLQHAFETLKAIRVQIKTDSRNLNSQRAIERIGGVKEGILRNHVIMPDGYFRHSVYYSILNSEWPTVKARLEDKLSLVRSDLNQPTE